MTINILHLYYDLMNLYGEIGNIYLLKHSLEKEGLKVIQNLSRKEKQQLFTDLTAYNASTKNGIYNISISDKTNKEAILSAIKYISQYMPENAKVWAAYKNG